MANSADDVLAMMERVLGRPVTREEFISFNYGDSDVPSPWTYEDELQMPERLQDFSRWLGKEKAPEGA